MVLLFNGLCVVAGLLVRVAVTTADEGDDEGTAAKAAEATAAAAASIVFLAAGLVMLMVSFWCPELPHPLGGVEVSEGFLWFFFVLAGGGRGGGWRRGGGIFYKI